MGKVQDKPWVVNGEIKIRKILNIVYTIDHRIGDAALAVRAFKILKKCLENPHLLESLKYKENQLLNSEILDDKKIN